MDKTTVTLGREQYKPSVSRGTYVKYSVELINVEGMKRPYLGELFSVSLKPNGEMHLCNEQVCYEVHRLVAGDPLLTLVASEETFGQMDARSAKSDAEQRFPVKR